MEQGVSVDEVRSELSQLGAGAGNGTDAFSSWELDTLVDHIIATHHAYVKEAIPILIAHTQKVASVHGARHEELIRIRDGYREVAEEMTQHMMKEELMLFPYIKALARSARTGEPLRIPPFQTIRNPIRMMEAEHVSAGNGTDLIRKESAGYTIPADACTTYRITYQELEAFEQDLHKHVHLENNILFPKAVELERTLFASGRTV